MAGYKNFLSTPSNRSTKKKSIRDNAFEFTPIGAKFNHEDSDSDSDFSILQDSTNKKASNDSSNKLKNGGSYNPNNHTNEHEDTENSFESFQTSTPNINDSVVNGISSVRSSAKENNKSFANNYSELLNNTSNPLNQQQELINSLKRDNYGLKVKVSSLQQYLTDDYSIPENVKLLIQENSELKFQLSEQAKSLLNISKTNNKSANLNNPDDHNKLNGIINDQRSEIQDLRSKVSDFEKNYALLEDKLANLQQNYDSVHEGDNNNNIKDLQFEIRNKEEELEQKALEIDVLQQKIRRLENVQTHDVEDYSNLEAMLKEKEEEIENLNNQLTYLRQDISKLSKDKDIIELNYSSADREKSQLDSEITKLKFHLRNHENEITLLNDKLKKADEINVSNSRKIDELNNKISILTSENNFNDNEVSKLKSYINSLENQMSSNNNYDLEKEIKRLRLIEDSLRNEITEYKQYIFELETSKEDLMLKDEEFLREVEKVEKERDAAYDDVQVYENYILDLESRLEDSINNHHILESQLRTGDETMFKLNQEIDSLKLKLRSINRNNESNNNVNSNQYDNNKSFNGGFLSSLFGSSNSSAKDSLKENTTIKTEISNNNSFSANAIIRTLSEEKEQMNDEIRKLHLEIRQLKDRLSTKKDSFESDYEKQEIKRLYKEVNDLQVKLVGKNSTNEAMINDYKDQLTKLNTSINMLNSSVERLTKDVSMKDIEILKLQKSINRFRGNNNHNESLPKADKTGIPADKSSEDNVSSNIAELKVLKEKLNLERQLMELEFSHERKERENERKIDFLNEEINLLKKSLINSTNSTTSNGTIPNVKKEDSSENINQESSIASSNNKDAYNTSTNVDYWKTKYGKSKEDFKAVYKKYRALQSVLDQHDNSNKIRINGLKQEIKIKDEEINELKTIQRVVEHGNRGKHVKLEELTDELNNLQFNNTVYDSHDNKVNEKQLNNHKQALNNKVTYYREKYHKQLYIISDLRFAYQYLKQKLKDITNSNIDDLIKLGKLTPETYKLLLIEGISDKKYLTTNDSLVERYNFGEKKTKLSFKVLAKCILAAIRIKNRWLKNKVKEQNLKKIEYHS